MIAGNIIFLPESPWGWVLFAVLAFIFYRRLTARDLGRTVGNYRSAARPAAEAPRAIALRDEALERNFKALDLTSSASYEQVKNSYRELVKVWHPDRFGNDAKLKLRANEKLIEINQAYEELKQHFER